MLGDKLRPAAWRIPWALLDGADAVFFGCGDPEALREVRARARVVVATARELPTLQAAGVELDALVASSTDDGEAYRPGELDPPPQLAVLTARRRRPRLDESRRLHFRPAPLPGPGGGRLRMR